MIFATSGTQLPFDRFVKAIDELAASLGEEIVVQSIPGHYAPTRVTLIEKMPHTTFIDYIKQARIVVSHAGMGTILSALNLSKPIIIMPREASRGEHRNNHQVATADIFEKKRSVYVARDNDSLRALITREDITPLGHLGENASSRLVDYVDRWIQANA